MTTDMGGTQGKSARCPREEPTQRLFRAEFRSREPRHGNRGKKRRKFMPRWLRGGALLNWGPFRAWIGSRLKPSGKCRTRVLHHICYLLRRSDCFRPSDRLAGWDSHPLEIADFHGILV